jgi:hypothetical protein
MSLPEPSPAERAADRRIVVALASVDFNADSAEWRDLARPLFEYGYAVLMSWAVSGMLPCRAAQYGGISRARVPEGLRLSTDDAHDLVMDVLMVALDRFREKSLPAWDPSGPASLRTYFIRRCLMELAGVHTAWSNPARREDYSGVDLSDYVSAEPDPARQVSDRYLVDDLLDSDPVLARAFRLLAAGLRPNEVFAELQKIDPSLTRSKYDTDIYRFRQRIRRDRSRRSFDD